MGKNPSTEGVQRDLLPLIEGTTVSTKLGDINTSHILFVCAGAFHLTKPHDLMPELLGRLPNRIALRPLTKGDFREILTRVECNLLLQQKLLMKAEGIDIEFKDSAVELICSSMSRITSIRGNKPVCREYRSEKADGSHRKDRRRN